MKKEKFVIILVSIFLITITANLITAQDYNIDWVMNEMGNAFASIFAPIFGVGTSSEFLFSKILLFFLLFSVIFMTTKRISVFDENIAVQFTVSIIFAILSVRYLKETDLMHAILLPSGTLGASITIFLPLLVYFLFLHSSEIGGFGRRAGWIVYGVVFLVLWGSREYNDMSAANWIYGLGLLFVLASLIFDKQVHKYFRGMELESSTKSAKNLARIDIKRKMTDIGKAYKDGAISKTEYGDAMKDLKKKYKNL